MIMKKKVSVVLLILLDIILSWIVFYICDMKLSLGPDIIEYENWFGTIENPIQYRFGTGSLEITLSLVQMIIFAVIEARRAKKYPENKKLHLIAFWIHIANGVEWIIFITYWKYLIPYPDFVGNNMFPQFWIKNLLNLIGG